MAKYRIVSKGSLVTIKCKLSRRDRINERELQYLLNNYTSGLFRVFFDGKRGIEYTAPTSISLEKFLENRILDEAMFWKIIVQIIEIVKTAEICGLYANHLWLDERVIFINETTQEMYFVYQPFVNEKAAANAFALINDITYAELKKQTGLQSGYLLAFQEFLSEGDNYRLEQIYGYVASRTPENCRKLRKIGTGRSGFLASNISDYEKHDPDDTVCLTEDGNDTVCLMDAMEDEGTVVLGNEEEDDWDEGETTVLTVEKEPETEPPALLHKRLNKKIQITGTTFLLGKGSASDYCVLGNSAVSRKHACITKEEDGYYLSDLESTNGTFLNGRLLEREEKVLLNADDEIVLADEVFVFEMI